MIVTNTLEQEMIFFLQNYLRIDTTHPQPDYKAVCSLFQIQAQQDGFLYNPIILPSGNPAIVITHQGSNPSLPALLLNHHMDVVPVSETEKWITPPFAATITNDVITARGVQDMKSIGVLHYFALKEIKKSGLSLERTVHIVAIPDEEIGGFTGTKEFIETEFFKTMNIGFVMDEGLASGDPQAITVKITERKPLQITMTVTGKLMHSSMLNCFNPIHELITLLKAFVDEHKKQQAQSFNQPEGLLPSMNITSIKAGINTDNHLCLNIIPDYARATIDIRIPPTMLTQEMINFVESIIDKNPNSSYQINAMVPDQPNENCYYTNFYKEIAQTIRHYGLTVKPLFFEGASDLRYYKTLGIDGVGLSPFTTNNTIHCTNESLPIADFIQGKNIMTHIIKNFCAQQKDIS